MTASEDQTARLWEAASSKLLTIFEGHTNALTVAVFSPDGKWVLSASKDGTARLWEAATGKAVVEALHHDGYVYSAVFSPDGKWVLTACSDGTARLWQAATGKPVGQPLRHDRSVASAAFNPDGIWVVTASADSTARVWEAAIGKSVGQPLRHGGAVASAAFSPDEVWVVTASADRTAEVWEVATGRAVGEALRHDGRVNGAEFGPGGKLVVTASSDGTAAFSPDGKWVVTASADGTARVWETATGKAVGEPLQHSGDVSRAAFGPDGKWVVTASNDSTARLWEAPLWEPLSEQLINVVKLLPALIGHLDFDANGFLKAVPNSRLTQYRDQISIGLKQSGISGSFLAIRIEWFLADQRTRSINPTSRWTVPSFILSTISWYRKASGHARNLVSSPRKTALDEAYELDPAFPLIHLALAAVETDPERAAFFRDFDLNRLPDSCRYATGLDRAEITLEAAQMCAEQKDWPRALVALDKYAKVGKANARSEALRVQTEKSILDGR